MATWVEDITTALNNLGGVAPLSDIYNEVRRIRPQPYPESLEAIVRGIIEQHSSDSAKFSGRDIFYSANGIGNGVWGTRESELHTPKAKDIVDPEPAPRAILETYRILRDTKLARELKQLHQNRCQLCGQRISLADNKYYSEAHHIRPLGSPFNGPDVAGNILIVCPNHHVMLDYGAIELGQHDLIRHPHHIIDDEFISFHNNNIFEKE